MDEQSATLTSINRKSVQDAQIVEQQSMTEDQRKRLSQQGYEYLQNRQWDEAVPIFQQLLHIDYDDDEAFSRLILALDQTEKYELLLQIAREFAESHPDSALALAAQARAFQKLGQISQATIANDQALLLDRGLALAWFNRSGLQLLQQHYPEALRYAEKTLELDPTDARAWANKGMALLNLNRVPEALLVFEQALTHNPDYLFALQAKGDILLRRAKAYEAIETMEHALALNPEDVPSLTLMAQALRALGEHALLQHISERLLQKMPDSLFARENHLQSLRGQGKFEEAILAADAVLELEPLNVRFWTQKADTLYRLGRYREASTVADHALQLDMLYPPARRLHEKAIRLMYQKKRPRR